MRGEGKGLSGRVAQALLPVRFCTRHVLSTRRSDDSKTRTGKSACATRTCVSSDTTGSRALNEESERTYDTPLNLPRPLRRPLAASEPYCFIIWRICRYCFSTWFTSWTEVPLPRAMRFLRLASLWV